MDIKVGDVFRPSKSTPIITGCLPSEIRILDNPAVDGFLGSYKGKGYGENPYSYTFYIKIDSFLGNYTAVMNPDELNSTYLETYKYEKEIK